MIPLNGRGGRRCGIELFALVGANLLQGFEVDPTLLWYVTALARRAYVGARRGRLASIRDCAERRCIVDRFDRGQYLAWRHRLTQCGFHIPHHHIDNPFGCSMGINLIGCTGESGLVQMLQALPKLSTIEPSPPEIINSMVEQ